MKKVFFISIFLAVIGFSTMAHAVLYDDFGNSKVLVGSTEDWGFAGSLGLFSESDGKLNFLSGGKVNEFQALVSQTSFYGGDYKLAISFFNFSSTNSSTPFSSVALSLGRQTNTVSIARIHNGSGDLFVFAHKVNGVVLPEESWVAPADNIASGSLGLHFDGTSVTAAYSLDPDAVTGDSSWQPFFNIIKPGWTDPYEPLAVVGQTGPSGDTTFQVDNVRYSKVPEPATILLLGLGLVGLAGVRRKFKK